MNENKPKAYPIINKNNCKACGRCILYCKKNCLVLSKGINNKGYQYAEYTGEGCIGCGDCYYTCPEPLAIEVRIPVQKRNYKGE